MASDKQTLQKYTRDQMQPNGCKLFVPYKFHMDSTPILRLGNLASGDASIDYTALRI